MPPAPRPDAAIIVRESSHLYRAERDRTAAAVTEVLGNWRVTLPAPRGKVYSGEAGVRVSGDDSFGVDVVYADAEQVAAQTDDTTLLTAPVTLAVEVLSPGNTVEDVWAKTAALLGAGVAAV